MLKTTRPMENTFEGTKIAFVQARDKYWSTYKELEDCKRIMERAQADMQRTCAHEYEKDWSSRGRSRWECKHCGILR